MRPIDRGVAPRSYTNYQDAQADLVTRIGSYCSYCERYIETHLAVEHIHPKFHRADLRNAWGNFLLGCANCNSCKGSVFIISDDYLWPDADNTLRVFDYTNGCITVHSALEVGIAAKAQALIDLCGLDKEPGHANPRKRASSSDKRWKRRLEIWDLAQRDLQRLRNNDSIEVRELIIENALARGLFSIWMQVFTDDRDMRCRFIQAFTGTDQSCFDISGMCTHRAGGKV